MPSDVCDEMRLLVQADIDGELQPAEAARLAAHLLRCSDCIETQSRLLALSSEIRRNVPRHAAPDALRAEMQKRFAPPPVSARRWPQLFAMPGLSFAVGAALAACLTLFVAMPAQVGLSDDVVDAHIRALQPGHLIDVVSTDQHTVKPWFDGRLPFAPPVKDIAANGFPLAGGRLDYLHGHTAATLVYRAGPHIIDLFTWPSAATAPTRSGVEQGYNFVSWSQGGMAFYAVSDLNKAELDDFVGTWQRN